MFRFAARFRSFWRGMHRPARMADEMEKEMRFHVEMEAERLMRERGLGAEEARRQARVAFGSADRFQEEGRDARGLSGISGASLDVKLGARMLAKYPGVSIVGLLALTIGIGLGAAYLEIVSDFLHPRLPLPEGDRIVGLQNWDAANEDPEPRALHDFVAWREQLRTVTHVSAFRSIERNIGDADRAAAPAHGAEISASAFALTRVPALHGRTLLEADEQVGAPDVVVLEHELWRTRFGGDTRVIGRTVQLGGSNSTVVGVMPEGFGFPVSHEFWVPLRLNPLAHAPREGPALQIFGRLADGASVGAARAELEAIGRRAAAASPTTHEHLRPRVLRYTQLFVGGEGGGGQAFLVEFLFVMLLLVLSSNVATMMFARTATRESEITVRFALGASRRRILAQFFLEALVLAGVATVVALAFVAWGTKHVTRVLWNVTEGQVPFWLDSRMNPSTVVYAAVLAVIGSFVAGVLPALKATGAQLQARLREPGNPGGSALRFGGLWSAVIVVQVTFAVLVLPPAIVAVRSLSEPNQTDPGFNGAEYLSARIEIDAEQLAADSLTQEAAQARFALMKDELQRRLAAHPDISAVTFATQLPGMDHQQPAIEVEALADAPGAVNEAVMTSSVDPGYFDTFDAQIIAGRDFSSGDLAPDARVVIVNQHFVDEILHGRNAVGRRVRYAWHAESATGALEPVSAGPWYEIVGVVSNLGMDTGKDAFFRGWGPGMYLPLTPARMHDDGGFSVRVAFHVRGEAGPVVPHLREAAHTVHPALRLYDVLPLDRPVDRVNQMQRMIADFSTIVTALVGLVALLISIAGIYSVLSFTVARQTREIGIRMALGAGRRRIITGVFSRALAQIGAGILTGMLLWTYVIVYEFDVTDRIGLLGLTALILLLVGVLACGVPVRRALRIEPAAALKESG